MGALLVNLGVGKVVWSDLKFAEFVAQVGAKNEFGAKLKEDTKKKEKLELVFEGVEISGIRDGK